MGTWAAPIPKPVIVRKAMKGGAPTAEKTKTSLGGTLKKPRLPPLAVPAPRTTLAQDIVPVGDDILGGRAEGVPAEVHDDMVALATSGDIPVTKPVDRAKNMTMKKSFYGDALFRDACRFGYIHPSSTAPKGKKWKSVRLGAYKLVEI